MTQKNHQCMQNSLKWHQDIFTYFRKVCSTHSYKFEKDLFNTFLQIWDRCVQLILTNFITKHSYKFEKGLFNSFLHIWERFVQHSRQTASSWGWGRIWKLWGIANHWIMLSSSDMQYKILTSAISFFFNLVVPFIPSCGEGNILRSLKLFEKYSAWH